MLKLLLAVAAFVTVPFSVQIYELFARYQVVRQSPDFRKCKPPPHDGSYDYLGLIKILTLTRHLLNKTALSHTVTLFEKYGDTYASSILASTMFFTCDPQNIKHVLVTRFIDYDSSIVRAHLFRPITEHGIFAVDGPAWRVSRGLYRNEFSHIRSILDLKMLEQHIQKLFQRFPPAGTTFDLQPLFTKFTLDATTFFAMGESVDSLSLTQSKENSDFVESLMYVQKIIARDGFLGPLHVLSSKQGFYRACGNVHRYVERIILRALEKRRQESKISLLEKSSKGYNLLQSLTENTDNVVALRDGVISVLIGGIESVANLLSATFWLLVRHKRVFQKLRATILETLGQEIPTYEQLKSMTYLRYVFNESMRLYPPVPFNARIANKDTTLPVGGGSDGTSAVLIKSGEKLVFSSWASHRSFKSFGDDAHDFIPERWEQGLKAEALGYIPFNSGPRVCPGQQYALMEASYATVRIVQTVSDIKNHDARGWTEKIGLMLSNENGVLVEVTR